MQTKSDPYKILGVSSNASDKEIQKAHRQKVFLCHPDYFPGDAEKAKEFLRVSEAFEAIKTQEKRDLFKNTSGVSLRRGAEGAQTSFYRRMFQVEE